MFSGLSFAIRFLKIFFETILFICDLLLLGIPFEQIQKHDISTCENIDRYMNELKYVGA